MQWDAEDPSRRTRHRDAELKRYVAADLGVFTPHYRDHFAECGVDPRRVRGLDDLARVRPTAWDDLAADPAAFLVRPDRRTLARHGDRRTVLALLGGTVTRRLNVVNRSVIEPRYKPLLWLWDHDVPIAYTDADLDLVARAGSRVLDLAGLDRSDVVAGLTDAGPHLAHWQLVLGAREAGVTLVPLGAAPDVALVVSADPTALAGTTAAVLAALATATERGVRFERLRTVIVTGEDPDPATRDAIAIAAAGVTGVTDDVPAVVASWAPRGARAHWGECRDGDGFHTFPDLEVVEVGRDGALHESGRGEVAWSGLGWGGTAVLRLLTGTRAEVVDTTCSACGRKGPMVVTGTRAGLDMVDALRTHEGVTSFHVEVAERDGRDEVVVFLSIARDSDLIDVLDDVDEVIDATQYVVLSKAQVEARSRKREATIARAR